MQTHESMVLANQLYNICLFDSSNPASLFKMGPKYFEIFIFYTFYQFIQFYKKFLNGTVKLGDKEPFDKEQSVVKELFTDYQTFNTINLLLDKELLP